MPVARLFVDGTSYSLRLGQYRNKEVGLDQICDCFLVPACAICTPIYRRFFIASLIFGNYIFDYLGLFAYTVSVETVRQPCAK